MSLYFYKLTLDNFCSLVIKSSLESQHHRPPSSTVAVSHQKPFLASLSISLLQHFHHFNSLRAQSSSPYQTIRIPTLILKSRKKKIKNSRRFNPDRCLANPFFRCFKCESSRKPTTKITIIMLGAVQFGVLAACIVLFVPMGLAGWHLSRNKMLFFSGALFITLAVGVHLTPYFPSISSFISSSSGMMPSVAVASANRESCISLLHDVEFHFHEQVSNDSSEKSWNWIRSRTGVLDCDFQKLSRSDASELLNGSWVVVAGDSQARLVVVSLLELVLGTKEMQNVSGDLFKRHSDYHIVVDEIGMKLDFMWAPYISNLTNLMINFREKKLNPDVFVMGAGLWDMLHVNNATEYGISVKMLKDTVMPLIPVTSDFEFGDKPAVARTPHMFWLGMPTLVNERLNTEEKKVKMTDLMRYAYDEELYKSKLVWKFGGPLLLLDIRLLSNRCGRQCSVDGMHYDKVVYEAAIHIMLNALLIKSQQKL